MFDTLTMPHGALQWLCPRCATPLDRESSRLVCRRDGFSSRSDGSIRDFLTEGDQTRLGPFLNRYQAVRRAEGRGSDSSRFYLQLPANGPGREWRMRTRGLAWLSGLIPNSPGIALDAGAGCCWLTRHLVQRGLHTVAMDINTDERDGLGAGRHYMGRQGLTFERLCATFERLPFSNESFDLVVFNASFHYAVDKNLVLREATRVTRRGGLVVVLDSPIYSDRQSGHRMSRERGGAGFLVHEDMPAMAHAVGIELSSSTAEASTITRLRKRWTEVRLGRETAEMSRLVFRC